MAYEDSASRVRSSATSARCVTSSVRSRFERGEFLRTDLLGPASRTSSKSLPPTAISSCPRGVTRIRLRRASWGLLPGPRSPSLRALAGSCCGPGNGSGVRAEAVSAPPSMARRAAGGPVAHPDASAPASPVPDPPWVKATEEKESEFGALSRSHRPEHTLAHGIDNTVVYMLRVRQQVVYRRSAHLTTIPQRPFLGGDP